MELKRSGNPVCTLLLFTLLLSCTSTAGFKKENSPNVHPLASMIAFYQGPLDHLSAVRSGSCPMYPSCSHYAEQSINQFGALLGWAMACDRLIRCGGDELSFAPKIIVDDRVRYYDPVKNNQFWHP